MATAKGRLGSGPVSLSVLNRGGAGQVATIPNVANGHFVRRLDATGTVEVTIPVGSIGFAACCEQFGHIRKWRHELAVTWGDQGDEAIAFIGPIVNINWTPSEIFIQGADLSAWWSRRLQADTSHVASDLTTIFLDYHNAAVAADPSINFSVVSAATGIVGTREVFADDVEYVSDGIQELARTGIDWTVKGRTVLVGPTLGSEVSLTLSDSSFVSPPEVIEAGDIQANRVIVRGGGDDGQGAGSYFYGRAEDANAIAADGLLERVFDEPDILDEDSANFAAASRLALLRSPMTLEASGENALKPNAPVTLDGLIPGRLVRIDSTGTCRPISGTFRISEVKVEFSGAVSVNLQPIGSL